MFYELSEVYEPERYLFREKQVEEIGDTFVQFARLGMGFNYIIQGATGTGKTSIVKTMMKKYNNAIYYNCKDIATVPKLLRKISNMKRGTITSFLKKTMEDIKEKKVILILDEVASIRDVKMLGDVLNSIYRHTQMPIILITNQFNIIRKWRDDARTTLCMERIDLPCYDAIQLSTILKERVNLIKSKNPGIEFPSDSIAYVSAYVANEFDSSVRILFKLASRCLIKNNFSQDYIKQSAYKLNLDDLSAYIHDKLTKQEIEFLDNLIDLKRTYKYLTTNILTKEFRDYSPSRVSQFITALIDAQLIHARYENRGRAGGRFRVIEFNSPVLINELVEILHPEQSQDEEDKIPAQ